LAGLLLLLAWLLPAAALLATLLTALLLLAALLTGTLIVLVLVRHMLVTPCGLLSPLRFNAKSPAKVASELK
jgi:hypothetical protein